MEKIKIPNAELEIVKISEHSPLLEIVFPQVTSLSGKDLSAIEILTSGGVRCTTLNGYITIYKVDGNTVILSNDGSIYTEPIVIELMPVEPYVSNKSDLAR